MSKRRKDKQPLEVEAPVAPLGVEVPVEDGRDGEPGGKHTVHPDGRQDAEVLAKPYRAKSKVQK